MSDQAKFTVKVFEDRVGVRYVQPALEVQVSDLTDATFDPSGSGVLTIPDVNGEVWVLNPKAWSVIRAVPVPVEGEG